jgi:hypothetical protein
LKPAAKRKPPPRRPRRLRRPKVVRTRRTRFTAAPAQVVVETPLDVFAVTATGTFTYLQIRGSGFDNGFKVDVTETVLAKTWSPATTTAVKALRGGRLLVAKFQVTSTGTAASAEETGQVDITVTTSGGASPPIFRIPLPSVLATYVPDVI